MNRWITAARCTLIGFAAGGVLFAATPTVDLVIEVKGVRAAKGSIRTAIYRKAADYKQGITAATDAIPATAGTVLVRFVGLEPGTYAVTLFHDEDDNGVLAKNAVGLPTEGYGFGNNARGLFGPPAFDKMAVKVAAPESRANIDVRY